MKCSKLRRGKRTTLYKFQSDCISLLLVIILCSGSIFCSGTKPVIDWQKWKKSHYLISATSQQSTIIYFAKIHSPTQNKAGQQTADPHGCYMCLHFCLNAPVLSQQCQNTMPRYSGGRRWQQPSAWTAHKSSSNPQILAGICVWHKAD